MFMVVGVIGGYFRSRTSVLGSWTGYNYARERFHSITPAIVTTNCYLDTFNLIILLLA